MYYKWDKSVVGHGAPFTPSNSSKVENLRGANTVGSDGNLDGRAPQ